MDSRFSALIDVGALVGTPSDSNLLFDEAASPTFPWSEWTSPQDWTAPCAYDTTPSRNGLADKPRQPAFRKHSSSSSSSISGGSGGGRSKRSRKSSFPLDTDGPGHASPISSLPSTGHHEATQDFFTTIDEVSPPSTPSISSLEAYGIPIETSDASSARAWRCAYPTCSSRATFTRGSDLRKHYHRHSKHLFCRYDGCPRSERVAAAIAEHCEMSLVGGFSHQHDLERHEAQHKPTVQCTWVGRNGQRCPRMFSRTDNMKDHVKRVHGGAKRKSRSAS